MSAPTILHATFTARPGAADRVAALLRDFAETVRGEEGNVFFDAIRLVDGPRPLLRVRGLCDEAAFPAHLANPAGTPFNAALQELIVEPSSQPAFLTRI